MKADPTRTRKCWRHSPPDRSPGGLHGWSRRGYTSAEEIVLEAGSLQVQSGWRRAKKAAHDKRADDKDRDGSAAEKAAL